jgi:hypothetical protein
MLEMLKMLKMLKMLRCRGKLADAGGSLEAKKRWRSACQAAQFISLELTKSKKKGFADSAPPSSAMHFVT